MFVDIFNTDKKYKVIYADPPWKFSSKELQKYDNHRFRSLDAVYSTVKTSDMKTWNVKKYQTRIVQCLCGVQTHIYKRQ